MVNIRFNNSCEDGIHVWRLIIDGEEHLAANVIINCNSWTSQDVIPTGETKWHISCNPTSIVKTEVDGNTSYELS